MQQVLISENMTEIQLWQDELESLDAAERIAWACQRFNNNVIATSSFGIQSAVCLHLISEIDTSIPVVFIDTGYLFQETYRYASELKNLLNLDIRHYCPKITPAHMEALYGRLWESGPESLERYLKHCKIEPMKRALADMQPSVWIAGLRRLQSDSRENRPVIEEQNGILKLYPIIDWDDTQISEYLDDNLLPRHPLEEEGFVSVGDWHSTSKLQSGMRPQDTRFGGEKRECGLHEYRKSPEG